SVHCIAPRCHDLHFVSLPRSPPPRALHSFPTRRSSDLSAFENLSLAILEGMACGTAVLGTPGGGTPELVGAIDPALVLDDDHAQDRKSTRLNSSHDQISYAVFCLKKKTPPAIAHLSAWS